MHSSDQAESETFQLAPEAVANLSLAFAPVENRPIARKVLAAGVVRLDENRVYEVVPRISGVVEEIHAGLGDRVAAGDALFALESAELAEAISSYIDAEERMQFAVKALTQEKALSERNLSSAEQLRERELAYRQALAAHERALQPLKLLHFDEGTIHRYLHEASNHNYTRLEITAPGAGEVIDWKLRRGRAVEPGETLLTVADLSKLWIDFQVPLRDSAALGVGQTIEVASTVGEENGTAEIVYVAPLADEASRTVLARAEAANPDGRWRPGTPVTVFVAGQGGVPTLTVPAGAVFDYDGEKAVFAKVAEGSFRLVPIKVGEGDGTVFPVLEGLDPTTVVVSRNAALLKSHLEMTIAD